MTPAPGVAGGRTAAALLLVIGLAHFGPELLAELTRGTLGAWDYVAQGAQATVLWLCVALLWPCPLVRLVAALGAAESLQRPVCRLLLPMHQPPQTGGRNLCEVAIGPWSAWWGLCLALLVALVVQEARRGWART